METINKIIKVLAKNLGLTIVFFAAIILFAIFSDGLLAGLITALSALIAYTCCELLYREYKSETAHKSHDVVATTKPTSARSAKPAKRSVKKK